uniref:Uncharacterized protein n=1 Tax=Setaria italica TaxID=4555 RepID=A0A0Q3NZ10_SETIT
LLAACAVFTLMCSHTLLGDLR